MLGRAARSARPRLSDMSRLRAVTPGMATRRASSITLQISWPSMAATGRSAQRCASRRSFIRPQPDTGVVCRSS